MAIDAATGLSRTTARLTVTVTVNL